MDRTGRLGAYDSNGKRWIIDGSTAVVDLGLLRILTCVVLPKFLFSISWCCSTLVFDDFDSCTMAELCI